MTGSALPPRYERVGPAAPAALEKLMAMRAALGITRVADITGLDVLGIPVMQAVQPFSRSLAVSQGKGADAISAAISAILECAETHFAERRDRFDLTIASTSALHDGGRTFANFLHHDALGDWERREIEWVQGRDLLSGAAAMVPFELVHTDFTMPPSPREGLFVSSTTGLAAAFAESDAEIHGILECVERDALAQAMRTHGFFQKFRIDPSTIDAPVLRDLLDMLAGKGMLAGLWHAPSRCGLPVVWCKLMEREGVAPILPFAADGSAASGDCAAAALHAIYEAAQTRLAAISAAREDITRISYPRYLNLEDLNAQRRMLADSPRPLHFRSLAVDLEAPGASGILNHLARQGISSVIHVPIDCLPHDLAITKIVIPQLHPLRGH